MTAEELQTIIDRYKKEIIKKDDMIDSKQVLKGYIGRTKNPLATQQELENDIKILKAQKWIYKRVIQDLERFFQ